MKQDGQLDEAALWLKEAKHDLKGWGAYYRAGCSGLVPRDSVIGRARDGHIQQPINACRVEYANKNDAIDVIVSGLPDVMRRSIVEVYGMRYSYREVAERWGMNFRAFRDLLQAAEGGVAVGLSLLEESYQTAVRTKRLARMRVA